MKAVPDQIARWLPGESWLSLGTDGFGRSDTRQALRRLFGVDAEHVAVAVLAELARTERIDPATVASAIDELGIDPEGADPVAL